MSKIVAVDSIEAQGNIGLTTTGDGFVYSDRGFTTPSRPSSGQQPRGDLDIDLNEDSFVSPITSARPASGRKSRPTSALKRIVMTVESSNALKYSISEEEKEKDDAEKELDKHREMERLSRIHEIATLDREREFCVRMPPISTATFFSGKPNIEYIKLRVGFVMNKNPWLASRAFKDNFTKYDVNLQYSQSNEKHGASFQVVDEMQLPIGAKESASFDWLAINYAVGMAKDMVNKDLPLFKVTIVHLIQDQSFAIVVSMARILGDASTFYRIYGMIGSGIETLSMTCRREFEVDRSLYPKFMESDIFVNSFGWKLNLFKRKHEMKKNCLSKYSFIDSKQIQSSKLAYITAGMQNPKSKLVPYISTNDILMSSICTALKYDMVLMSIDCRKEAISYLEREKVAGNWEFYMCYYPEDWSKPEYIRKSISDGNFNQRCQRFVSKNRPMPGFWDSTKLNVGQISNLATFYQPLNLDRCKQLCHFPIAVPSKNLWNQIIIFNTGISSKLGIWTMEDQTPHKEIAGQLLKPSIMEVLRSSNVVAQMSFETNIDIKRILNDVPDPPTLPNTPARSRPSTAGLASATPTARRNAAILEDFESSNAPSPYQQTSTNATTDTVVQIRDDASSDNRGNYEKPFPSPTTKSVGNF